MRIFLIAMAVLCFSVQAEAEPQLLSPKEFADRMQPSLPMTTSTGNIITRIEADGLTLVWGIRIVDPQMDRLSVERMATLVAQGWCEMPLAEAFFKAGYSIRVDTESSRLGLRKGEVVRRCA